MSFIEDALVSGGAERSEVMSLVYLECRSYASQQSQYLKETHVPRCELMIISKLMILLGQGTSFTTSQLSANHSAGEEASRAVFCCCCARDLDT